MLCRESVTRRPWALDLGKNPSQPQASVPTRSGSSGSLSKSGALNTALLSGTTPGSGSGDGQTLSWKVTHLPPSSFFQLAYAVTGISLHQHSIVGNNNDQCVDLFALAPTLGNWLLESGVDW